jgi:hypothetical protein
VSWATPRALALVALGPNPPLALTSGNCRSLMYLCMSAILAQSLSPTPTFIRSASNKSKWTFSPSPPPTNKALVSALTSSPLHLHVMLGRTNASDL